MLDLRAHKKESLEKNEQIKEMGWDFEKKVSKTKIHVLLQDIHRDNKGAYQKIYG